MSTNSADASRTNRRARRTRALTLAGALSLTIAACTSQPVGDDTVPDIRVGYIAPSGAPASVSRAATFGVRLGMEEAAHAARLTGRTFHVRAREARTADEALDAAEQLLAENVIALAGGFDSGTCRALTDFARERRVVFFNLGCPDNSLRTGDRQSFVFHLEASDSMYAAARQAEAGETGESAVLWHAGLGRYGAGQLNDRFVRRFGEGATAPAWAGWMAMKVAWEAASHLPQPDATALARALHSPDTEFDGHKGEALRFSPASGQLLQPLYAVGSGAVVASNTARPAAKFMVSDASSALRAASQRGATLVVVTNEGSGDLTIFDADSMTVLGVVPTGHRPRGVRSSPDGRFAYVALSDDAPDMESDDDGIVVVDILSGVLVERHPAGSDPEQFVVSPDGTRLYSANEDAGTATISELRDGSVAATLVVGIEPEGVAVSPDGRWVYVTAETSNTVSVIDTEQDRVVSSFVVDVRPRAAVFSPDGRRAYVTNEISGTLSVVDVSQHAVAATIELDRGRARPVGVVTSPDGSKVFVANGRSNTISIIDAETQVEEAVIQVGERPWGIDVSPDGSRVFTANGLSNDVSVVDVASREVIATIPAGTRPWGVVVMP